RINADPRDVAVLPPETMRRFAWAGPAPVLDPLPRWVRADVLSTGDLVVSGRTVAGEGNRAREVQRLLSSGADAEALAAAGVGWVVTETGSTATSLGQLTIDYSDADLTPYRVGGADSGAPRWKRNMVIAAHLIWAGMLVITAAILAGTAYRRRAQS
ncbi:MAG: hypothetical protein NT146_11655, partial [Mycobacterium sp.]|nr:hypothetical protein [Mycobacterium sp.]